MKKFPFLIIILFITSALLAQVDSFKGTFLNPRPHNYEVKHAVEMESLIPMFITGGYHFAVGYRYRMFRVRLSIINGGSFNADAYSLNNTSKAFQRFYLVSPGIFFGYNIWKHLEVYTYLEYHTYNIQQQSTGQTRHLKSLDTGLGLSYQFFIGRSFYIQPGVHLYVRASGSTAFSDGAVYRFPNADVTPVIRIGFRLWSEFIKNPVGKQHKPHAFQFNQ